MSRDYVQSGRTRQKLRTRNELLAAARELIERGDAPTVEEAAEAAGISRTTAYRYFTSRDELLAAAFPETAVSSLLPTPAPEAVEDRVSAVVDAFISSVERTERQQRAMLRLSLSETPHELPLRQGRAIPWFEEALAPLRGDLGEDGVHRVALALRSVCGIETRVWLHDVAGLEAPAIATLQRWTAMAVLERAARGDVME